MNTRTVGTLVIVGAFVVVMSIATGPIAGQEAKPAAKPQRTAQQTPAAYQAPKTPWGEPDLQGVWGGRNQTVTSLERPAQYGDRQFLTDEEIAAKEREAQAQQAKRDKLFQSGTGADLGLGNQTFEERKDKDAVITGFEYNTFWVDTGHAARVFRQTSLVVEPKNGRIPYRPELRDRMAYSAKVVSSNPPADFVNRTWRDRDTGERCITDGLPASLLNGTGPTMITQGPGYVVILNEQFRDRRIIPTDGRPHRNIRGWWGHATGRWQGNTLVVETTNFIDMTANFPENRFAQEWRTPTHDMKLVERFTRVAEDTIDYELHVTAPSRFSEPFKVAFPFMKSPTEQQFFEYACHEGNYGMIHLLSQARNVEKGEKGHK